MAEVKKAKLSATGTGAELMLAVDVELDWDRGDDRVEWDLTVRFMGANKVRQDEVLLDRTVGVSPRDGDRSRIEVSGAGGVFDEDRGEDEVYAEVRLVPRASEVRVVTTNRVKGDFSG